MISPRNIVYCKGIIYSPVQVLKRAEQAYKLLLLESVGRRLGLNFIPMTLGSQFLLSYSEGKRPHRITYIIDTCNNWRLININGIANNYTRDTEDTAVEFQRITTMKVSDDMFKYYNQQRKLNNNVSSFKKIYIFSCKSHL